MILDVHAILSLTEPAQCPGDVMARRELCDDLYRLLRLVEERHGLPTPIDVAPPMQLRAALMAMIRALEAMHGLPQRIPPKRQRHNV